MRRLWEALPKLLAENPTARWPFLTLTVKNPPAGESRETLKQINAPGERLSKRKKSAAVLGLPRDTDDAYGKVTTV
ncbi:protein rep [Escherichia coli]|uniref:protein rep n=1 Tax=Escherichia coli TaxID=562 RepID=UPI0035B53810